MKTSTIIVLVIILILIAVGVYFLVAPGKDTSQNQQSTVGTTQNQQNLNSTQNNASTSYDIQGMKVEILQQGDGVAAKTGDTVT